MSIAFTKGPGKGVFNQWIAFCSLFVIFHTLCYSDCCQNGIIMLRTRTTNRKAQKLTWNIGIGQFTCTSNFDSQLFPDPYKGQYVRNLWHILLTSRSFTPHVRGFRSYKLTRTCFWKFHALYQIVYFLLPFFDPAPLIISVLIADLFSECFS